MTTASNKFSKPKKIMSSFLSTHPSRNKKPWTASPFMVYSIQLQSQGKRQVKGEDMDAKAST